MLVFKHLRNETLLYLGPGALVAADNVLFFVEVGIHMIDCLVNLAVNLRTKTFHKSTQEASKIGKKCHSKHDANWLGI